MVRSPKVLVDADNRIIAACVSPPTRGGEWPVVMEGFREAMAELERDYNWGGHRERRGTYLSTSYGYSFGGGQKVCTLRLDSVF